MDDRAVLSLRLHPEMLPQEARFNRRTRRTAVSSRRSLKKPHLPLIYLAMKFTYYGHACFSVQAGGKTLLFDPFITPNPLAKKIDVDKVAADFILVSHGHGDHVADVIDIAKRTGATVITSYEVGTWFEGKGVKNVQAMNHGGAAKTDFGRVKLTSAIHSSSMPDGSYGGNPCGFVIESGDGNFYYSGDTALTYDMKLIGEATKLDFAIFPIGDFFTMGIKTRYARRSSSASRNLSACTTTRFRRSSSIGRPLSPPHALPEKNCCCRASAKRSPSDFSPFVESKNTRLR